MNKSQVVSFRASGHFLNWIEAQRLEDESASQAAQRIFKEISQVYGNYKLYVTSGNPVSIPVDELSTLSTLTVDSVDKLLTERLDSVMERMAAFEERLGKLKA